MAVSGRNGYEFNSPLCFSLSLPLRASLMAEPTKGRERGRRPPVKRNRAHTPPPTPPTPLPTFESSTALAAPATPATEEEDDDDGKGMDPLEVLGPEILMMVMELLNAHSVARSVVVSRGWLDVACSDHLWAPLCEELWKGKAHIPCSSKVRGANKLAAYSMSMMDGKRTRIVKEDLCDHAWELRFKKCFGKFCMLCPHILQSAPEYWLNLDPSWKGTAPPMRRYFHPNGTQTADPDDQIWGGHECTFSIITSYVVKEGRIRNHYVRINRWPSMTVSRREDWSWEMANHLYCYNSVPDAEKEGGTGPFFPVW